MPKCSSWFCGPSFIRCTMDVYTTHDVSGEVSESTCSGGQLAERTRRQRMQRGGGAPSRPRMEQRPHEASNRKLNTNAFSARAARWFRSRGTAVATAA